MRRLTAFFAVLVFSAFAVFAQAGGAMFVAVESMDVMSSSGFFASSVGTLRLGDEVAVVRNSGRWSEIRAGNVAGWVASSALSPRPVLRTAPSAAPGEVALAGKGFGREVEIEYGMTGLDFSLVDEMEALVITPAELRQFIIEGRLSGGGQ